MGKWKSELERYNEWKAAGGRFIDTTKEAYPPATQAPTAKPDYRLMEAQQRVNRALADLGLPVADVPQTGPQSARERTDAAVLRLMSREVYRR